MSRKSQLDKTQLEGKLQSRMNIFSCGERQAERERECREHSDGLSAMKRACVCVWVGG